MYRAVHDALKPRASGGVTYEDLGGGPCGTGGKTFPGLGARACQIKCAAPNADCTFYDVTYNETKRPTCRTHTQEGLHAQNGSEGACVAIHRNVGLQVNMDTESDNEASADSENASVSLNKETVSVQSKRRLATPDIEPCNALCKKAAAAFDVLGLAKCNFLVKLCTSLSSKTVGLGRCISGGGEYASAYEGVGPFTRETCEETCFSDVSCKGYEFQSIPEQICRISGRKPSGSIHWKKVGTSSMEIAGSDGTDGVECYRVGNHLVISQLEELGRPVGFASVGCGVLLLLSFQFACCFLASLSRGKKGSSTLGAICCPKTDYEQVDGALLSESDSDYALE